MTCFGENLFSIHILYSVCNILGGQECEGRICFEKVVGVSTIFFQNYPMLVSQEERKCHLLLTNNFVLPFLHN
jgi:hypothetical protein